MFLKRLLLWALWLPAATAWAQRDSSAEALTRVEETVQMRVEDEGFSKQDLLPILVVSTQPAFEETRKWYPNAALATLVKVFGANALRSCEACNAPRVYTQQGRLEQVTTLDVPELIRIDESLRGTAAPAKTGLWLDETPEGVTLRIVDLRNSRIVVAQNFDPALKEAARTEKQYTMTRELDRRIRKNALTHTFFDVGIYPGQHVSLEFMEQWGQGNANLTGVTLALFDPVLGVGFSYYRVIPQALNLMVGIQATVSIPSAIAVGITGGGPGGGLLDPMLNAALVVRMPIASSNYGLMVFGSTNLRFGIGISLMNITLLPFLP